MMSQQITIKIHVTKKKNVSNDEQKHDKRLDVSGKMNIGETINKRLGRAIIQSSENIIQIETADIGDEVTEYVEKETNVDDSQEEDVSTMISHDLHSDKRSQPTQNTYSEMFCLSNNNHGFLNTDLQFEDESETDIEHPDHRIVLSLPPKHDLVDCSKNISPNQIVEKQRSKNNDKAVCDIVQAGTVIELELNHLKHETYAQNDSIQQKLDFFKNCTNEQSSNDGASTEGSDAVTDLYGNKIDNPDFATKNWDSDSSSSKDMTHSEEKEVLPVSLSVARTFDEIIMTIILLIRYLFCYHILTIESR